MEWLDLFLHIDKHLANAMQNYGLWLYAILFAIIFIETGFIVLPFLPGDSLLFAAGALTAIGGLSYWPLAALLITAAILGDALNYTIGRRIGERVSTWENSRWFNKKAFDRAHAFYEKHGAVTIIAARFIPFARSFAPFIAGMAKMTYPKFLSYNMIGAVVWVMSLTAFGYLLGNHPWVKANFGLVTILIIVISVLPLVIGLIKERMQQKVETLNS